jgi:hypothetical protein
MPTQVNSRHRIPLQRGRVRLQRLLSTALLLPSIAIAGGSGWTAYTTVAELTPTSHQRYTVRLNLSDNPSDCGSKDTFYQDYAASGAEQMFRTLLEAVASGKRVRIFVTGRCELNGYGEISSVSILP